MVHHVMRMYAAVARPALRLQRTSAAIQRPTYISLIAKPTLSFVGVQRRSFASTPTTTNENDDHEKQLVYEAPMARAVRLMKGVSVTSCFLTSVGMPVLCYVSVQSASVIGKWAMCGTIMLFGLGTTSLYHLLFEPYILRMWVDQKTASGDDARVTVENLTVFAQRTTRQFKLSDVKRRENSIHPMVSFRAQDRNYFIHPEVFQDEQLMKKFMGEDFKVIKKQPVVEADDYE